MTGLGGGRGGGGGGNSMPHHLIALNLIFFLALAWEIMTICLGGAVSTDSGALKRVTDRNT